MSDYLVELKPIEDDIILATDPDTGNELLRFGVQCAGEWIKVQFPKFGEYRQFLHGLQEILYLFSHDDESIKLPEEMAGVVKYSDFAAQELMKLKAALIVRQADIGRKVESLFYKFMRPELEIEGENLAGDKLKAWIADHASYDIILNMFAAVLIPEQLLKKKALLIMKRIYPALTKLAYSDTSTKNLDGQKDKSEAVQNFGFA